MCAGCRSVSDHGASQTLDTQSPSPAVALGIAQFKLTLTKDPQTRIRGLGFDPSADQGAFPTAVALRVGDRTRYRSQPASTGSVIERDLIVQGIKHAIDGMTWTVEAFVSAAPDTQRRLFLLDESELDGPDILGV